MIIYPSRILKISRVLKHKFMVRTLKTTNSICSSSTIAHSPNAKLNKSILDRYLCLPLPECVSILEYIWVDGTGEYVRSKSKTIHYIPDSHKEIPSWSFDGSSTKQAPVKDSDTQLIPVAMYNDPFRRGNNKLVLCEAYTSDNKPTPTNHRACCVESFNKVCDHEIMWGLEQVYHLMDVDGRPFGWPIMHGDPPAIPHYSGVGAKIAYGRDLIEAHYRACLYAGVQLAGCNAESNLSQWEYQIGICKGIKGADDLWMARFIMGRISEEYGVSISRAPKLLPNWNGSACHYNFSTKDMRADNGLAKIEEAIGKLCNKHKEHLEKYDPHGGNDNKKRLLGDHQTSSIDAFTNGVGDRSVSVRIPKYVANQKKGYFQDRRPASNSDPYQVCHLIVQTCLLD